jgi:hypothetical protein
MLLNAFSNFALLSELSALLVIVGGRKLRSSSSLFAAHSDVEVKQ